VPQKRAASSTSDRATSTISATGTCSSGEWAVHAAAARYASRPELTSAAATGEPSLFDEGGEA